MACVPGTTPERFTWSIAAEKGGRITSGDLVPAYAGRHGKPVAVQTIRGWPAA